MPAIYAGCILTLMPLFGIQLPLSLLLALVLRANLPILAGLQIVSNPITVIPIWFSAYQIGRHFLGVIGVDAAPLNPRAKFKACSTISRMAIGARTWTAY